MPVVNKRCPKCGITKPAKLFYKRSDRKTGLTSWCRACWSEHHAARPKGSSAAQSRKWRQENPERAKELAAANAKAAYTRLKLQVVEAYGSECECCGEEDLHFLTLDHREGVPDNHRFPSGKRITGYKLMRIIRDDNYPDYMRLLCWNCNLALANHGYCPHQTPDRTYRSQ